MNHRVWVSFPYCRQKTRSCTVYVLLFTDFKYFVFSAPPAIATIFLEESRAVTTIFLEESIPRAVTQHRPPGQLRCLGQGLRVGGPSTPPFWRTRDEFCTVWNSARMSSVRYGTRLAYIHKYTHIHTTHTHIHTRTHTYIHVHRTYTHAYTRTHVQARTQTSITCTHTHKRTRTHAHMRVPTPLLV